jgi:hypothetical protein
MISFMCKEARIMFRSGLLKGLLWRGKKLVLFVLIFHLLFKSRPITKYEQLQSLFDSSKCQTTHPSMVVIVLDGRLFIWFWLALIKWHYYIFKKVDIDDKWVSESFSGETLDLHNSLFKLTMKNQGFKVVAPNIVACASLVPNQALSQKTQT